LKIWGKFALASPLQILEGYSSPLPPPVVYARDQEVIRSRRSMWWSLCDQCDQCQRQQTGLKKTVRGKLYVSNTVYLLVPNSGIPELVFPNPEIPGLENGPGLQSLSAVM